MLCSFGTHTITAFAQKKDYRISCDWEDNMIFTIIGAATVSVWLMKLIERVDR